MPHSRAPEILDYMIGQSKKDQIMVLLECVKIKFRHGLVRPYFCKIDADNLDSVTPKIGYSSLLNISLGRNNSLG